MIPWRHMRILAIETSCDETAIAVLEEQGARSKHARQSLGDGGGQEKFKILSNIVLSQIKIHKPFGGVVPNLAKREHQKNLPIVLKKALKESKISPKKIDAIAVTYGPGLEPALWMGINFAQELAKSWKKPLIPVNHLEGHIYASWLPPRSENPKSEIRNPKFPLLALIVSGGHTELVLMKKHLDYKILGETLDDAAGEAFDKVAKMLKLGYPGGPEISKLAKKYLPLSPLLSKERRLFPRPMINSADLNFSFSGLKTAVLYYLRDNPNVKKNEIAYEFQQAVIDVLIKKTEKAIKKYGPKSLVVGGGVAANTALRHTLEALIKKHNLKIDNWKLKISLHLSPMWLTGDNATMIATAAHFRALHKKKKAFLKPEKIKAQGNLKLG